MFVPAYRKLIGLTAAALAVLLLAAACGDSDRVILATTTSTFDSGLLDELVPAFEDAGGDSVKVIAVGTGQALEMGRRGDADVLLVHAPSAELEFVEEGFAADRLLVMHNDFVIVGPEDDPAGVSAAPDALSAMRVIAEADARFISRGDDSGTHKRELAFWAELGLDPGDESWYAESGQGMGATLQIAGQRRAYALTDRATYLVLLDVLALVVVAEGDPMLLNIYHVMPVNPELHGGVNAEGADSFAEFLVSDEAQRIIETFGAERFGRPLFVPDAGKSEAELGLE